MNYLSGDKNAANQNKSQNPKNKNTLQRKGKTLMSPNAQRVLQLKEMVANSFQSKIAQRNALQNQYLNSAEGQRVQQLKSMIANSPQMQRAAQLQAMANDYAAQQQTPIQRVGKEEEELVQGKFKPPFPIQRKKNEEELLQGKFKPDATVQRKTSEEELVQGKFKPPFPIQRKKNEEELLQGKFKPDSTVQRKTSEEELVQGKFEQETPVQRQANNTGMPDSLKSGIENLSGYSMDDVKVHYNSDKPAQLQAHAYAQGTDIHLGSGQEKHLPHEAWHVVQQKQGRVKPTMQMKGKVNINDDKGLEREADVMGEKASLKTPIGLHMQLKKNLSLINNKVPIQRLIDKNRLNVVGEHHDESGARRGDEKGYAAYVFNKKYRYPTGKDEVTKKHYFEEHNFTINDGISKQDVNHGTSKQDVGDSFLLRTFMRVLNISNKIRSLLKKNDVKSIISHIERELLNLSVEKKKLSSHKNSTVENKKLLFVGEKLWDFIDKMVNTYNNKKPRYEDLLIYFIDDIQKTLEVYYSGDAKRREKIYQKYGTKEEMESYKDNPLWYGISFKRSEGMHDMANKMSSKHAIWKIGDAHIKDIDKVIDPNEKRKYNLMYKGEFDKELLFFEKHNKSIMNKSKYRFDLYQKYINIKIEDINFVENESTNVRSYLLANNKVIPMDLVLKNKKHSFNEEYDEFEYLENGLNNTNEEEQYKLHDTIRAKGKVVLKYAEGLLNEWRSHLSELEKIQEEVKQEEEALKKQNEFGDSRVGGKKHDWSRTGMKGSGLLTEGKRRSGFQARMVMKDGGGYSAETFLNPQNKRPFKKWTKKPKISLLGQRRSGSQARRVMKDGVLYSTEAFLNPQNKRPFLGRKPTKNPKTPLSGQRRSSSRIDKMRRTFAKAGIKPITINKKKTKINFSKEALEKQKRGAQKERTTKKGFITKTHSKGFFKKRNNFLDDEQE